MLYIIITRSRRCQSIARDRFGSGKLLRRNRKSRPRPWNDLQRRPERLLFLENFHLRVYAIRGDDRKSICNNNGLFVDFLFGNTEKRRRCATADALSSAVAATDARPIPWSRRGPRWFPSEFHLITTHRETTTVFLFFVFSFFDANFR